MPLVVICLPDNINFETLRLTDFRSGDDDGARLGDILGRYSHFLFSHCKLSWKKTDQYVRICNGKINHRLLLNGFYKQLRHNLHVQYDAVDLMQTSMTSWNIAAALL